MITVIRHRYLNRAYKCLKKQYRDFLNAVQNFIDFWRIPTVSKEFENFKAPKDVLLTTAFFFPLVCLFSSLYAKYSVYDWNYTTEITSKDIFLCYSNL